MPRVFSGIQPTGDPHIGNYFGAMRNYVRLGEEYGKNSIYCVVDLHAITNPAAYDPATLAQRTFEMAVANFAVGLDPEKVIFFVQSQVPEHQELSWVFTALTPVGELERMTQYKDKAEQLESIPAGLLMYPVLMAADILLYKADTVPVGEDQTQHIELTREIARKFNHAFGETFPEPKAVYARDALRIPGVDGQGKMSKSKGEGSTIGILEPLDSIWQKLRVAPTDPARVRRSDPGDPEKCLIGDYHKLFSDLPTIETVYAGCRTAGIGCVDCKKMLMQGITRELTPIQERAGALRADPDRVRDALATGARQAREIARPVMEEVREKAGFLKL
ncbi:tryptophan--tRNA ligase [Deinococcus metallilatus]|uniref:Tryptophan--tRNA ligase n=1 Tax=Deinococcus metallilatus TaxID=1211322 RepID=A0AAJ5F7W9_9DEIO|nr:tryptophan--tRNA ligase [Deinococcus metallilatus]MBB5296037.1 tryptophanyl-tRNA synthetase [Deinococcus metallilatus]QBY08149.1 tryptophan--tRNA ligase [Deinococcus metallilatus]RXJ11881.1 tryptophan--tRNA ligase [Deinococcus metallilatus]TLK25887.1 tryptophan--tRNA ligase [Deinococcus metallilatus]GMA14427.1 tryptophan--tRNA ligase [Deinococcus metallilatus]